VIFSAGRTGATKIMAVDLTTGIMKDLLPSGSDPQFVSPDWMLYRQAALGPLYAQRIDPETLRLRGEPTVVLDRVIGIRTLPSFAVSPHVLVAFK
jgi:hypothetical protein